MKYVLVVLLLFSAANIYSQDMRINLSAKNERLSVSLDENNINRTFFVKKTSPENELLMVTVSNEVINEDWKRTFTIHNSNDSAIAVLQYMGGDNYCISLKDLREKLQAGNQYYLYTIALPTDPKKRMLVKVARNLVCKIIVKN
jgi:hypothetical protein